MTLKNASQPRRSSTCIDEAARPAGRCAGADGKRDQRLVGVQARVRRCAGSRVFRWQMGSMAASLMTSSLAVHSGHALERVHDAATEAAPSRRGSLAGDHACRRAAPWRRPGRPWSPPSATRPSARASSSCRHAGLVHQKLQAAPPGPRPRRCGARRPPPGSSGARSPSWPPRARTSSSTMARPAMFTPMSVGRLVGARAGDALHHGLQHGERSPRRGCS